jgi:hypothetical protein
VEGGIGRAAASLEAKGLHEVGGERERLASDRSCDSSSERTIPGSNSSLP